MHMYWIVTRGISGPAWNVEDLVATDVFLQYCQTQSLTQHQTSGMKLLKSQSVWPAEQQVVGLMSALEYGLGTADAEILAASLDALAALGRAQHANYAGRPALIGKPTLSPCREFNF